MEKPLQHQAVALVSFCLCAQNIVRRALSDAEAGPRVPASPFYGRPLRSGARPSGEVAVFADVLASHHT